MSHTDTDGSHSEAVHAAEHDDDHGSHGGHGADPNEGVLKGTAPTPAWLGVVTLIAAVTLLGCILLAVKIG